MGGRKGRKGHGRGETPGERGRIIPCGVDAESQGGDDADSGTDLPVVAEERRKALADGRARSGNALENCLAVLLRLNAAAAIQERGRGEIVAVAAYG